jgi:adenylate kinase
VLLRLQEKLMRVIILLGAPGSGKGTTADRVKDEAGYTHVSTGDLLRAAVKKGTDVGKEAESYMQKGELVPDDVMIRIVEDVLDTGADDASYMFDGYPRTVEQADLLDKSLESRGSGIKSVIFLDVPRDVLINRLTGRRICRSCGISFHVVNIPPKVEGVCDDCGGELYQRADDSEETIANRLEVYNSQTESLISRYEGQGVLLRVDGDQGAQNLANEVKDILK